MDRRCFMVLCNMIKNIGGFGNSKHVTLEEKVALFINILAFDYASVMLSQVEWCSNSNDTLATFGRAKQFVLGM
ncbi:hypothetical protein RHGRI_038629 [Rhododendron griersonianum]|uniref:Uncharacterized protein n=1 Tax=Rhododendron griersonianum TaxID=479676 RepID=A0AAV6HMW8_9ERIC|nr:hypothetical protein RHGRI_038629 [Rhododendron griersonianum]